MEESTTIVVEVDQSGVIAAISDLSGEVSSLRSELESRAAAQSSQISEISDNQSRLISSSDSQAIGTLIFIGVILSLCISVFLFRK